MTRKDWLWLGLETHALNLLEAYQVETIDQLFAALTPPSVARHGEVRYAPVWRWKNCGKATITEYVKLFARLGLDMSAVYKPVAFPPKRTK